jgi:hypothetical protein
MGLLRSGTGSGPQQPHDQRGVAGQATNGRGRGRGTVGPHVLQYALDSTGSQIALLDLAGAITRSSLAALGSVRLRASGEAPGDNPLIVDHNGAAWTWEHIELKPNIVEQSSNGSTTTYGFPVTPITFSSDSVDGRIIPPGVSVGPPPTQVDPQLESLVSDEDGGIYVLTDWEGHGGPYASVYKLGT